MGYFALNSATQKNASPEPLEANELVLVDDAKSYESDDLSIQLGELASPEAYELAKKFAMSSDPNERLKMSRNPEQTKKHLPDYPAQAIDVPAERIDRGKILRSSDIVFRAFPAIFSDGSRRVICVLITDDGLRVDWDSYAFYGTATWPELLSGERKTADIRALASQRSYYNSRFHLTHGAPIHLGDPREIGINNLDQPEFGDPVTINPGEIPVFWACGVTSQLAATSAPLPRVI
ncbi:MAG TPA: hypothetical protein DEP88_05685, partial [Verrucomicrobiales bacterium]|nr:hypothetical protein [Verrucomicrobiales bacterium]